MTRNTLQEIVKAASSRLSDHRLPKPKEDRYRQTPYDPASGVGISVPDYRSHADSWGVILGKTATSVWGSAQLVTDGLAADGLAVIRQLDKSVDPDQRVKCVTSPSQTPEEAI